MGRRAGGLMLSMCLVSFRQARLRISFFGGALSPILLRPSLHGVRATPRLVE